jgi:deoxyribonuclease-4
MGTLGLETFRSIMKHPYLSALPMILETPNELPGYQKEIAILRDMA